MVTQEEKTVFRGLGILQCQSSFHSDLLPAAQLVSHPVPSWIYPWSWHTPSSFSPLLSQVTKQWRKSCSSGNFPQWWNRNRRQNNDTRRQGERHWNPHSFLLGSQPYPPPLFDPQFWRLWNGSSSLFSIPKTSAYTRRPPPSQTPHSPWWLVVIRGRSSAKWERRNTEWERDGRMEEREREILDAFGCRKREKCGEEENFEGETKGWGLSLILSTISVSHFFPPHYVILRVIWHSCMHPWTLILHVNYFITRSNRKHEKFSRNGLGKINESSRFTVHHFRETFQHFCFIIEFLHFVLTEIVLTTFLSNILHYFLLLYSY